MKKLLLLSTLAIFGMTSAPVLPGGQYVVVAQKDKKDKKDAPGPPVYKDKEPRGRDKQPPPPPPKKKP